MFLNYLLILILTSTDVLCEDKRFITTLMYSKLYVQQTIVNGDPATVGQIPYFVSIKRPERQYSEENILWKNLCGGSIIGVNKVLTAAHCFEDYNYHYLNNFNMLRVVAGNIKNFIIYSGKNITEPTNQWRYLNKVVIHSNFNFPNNDIALVFVNDWLYNDYITFVIPASLDIDYHRRCLVVGFGITSHGLAEAASHVLLVAWIDVLTKWQCSILWEMNMNGFICSDSALTDVARGDSGGPLVCKGTTDPAERSDRDLLVGIVSGKSFDITTLYTRVSAYRDWIARDAGFKLTSNALFCLITWFILLYV
ncbi:unnamed protein product [Parnassius mnemosyne]|uniref:Peptidase S1 domain-containing protein n=1 Tax=Parnassius mnemosyne TaxID=213953 RepID=A0AAV1LIZ6_9NEOP